MSIDVGGFSLSNTGGIKFATANTTINANGMLLESLMPAVWGAKIGVGTQRQYPWAVANTTINNNNVWNTSSFVFTAPVAGIYYVCLNVISAGGATMGVSGADGTATSSSSGYNAIVINGGAYCYSHWNTNNSWDCQNIETLVRLAVGDTVAYSINISPGPDSGSGAGAWGDNHNMMAIWLLG